MPADCLFCRIAAGEIDDIRGVLPDQFASLWPED